MVGRSSVRVADTRQQRNPINTQIRETVSEWHGFISCCWKVLSACTMFFSWVVSLLCVCTTARAFLPVNPLADCPNIPPQSDINIEQVAGTWRLAYLLVDENEDFEEDKTCAVAEIMQVNDTQLELLLYVDGREDEFTIERYTKEFDVTVVTPGEWLLHTSFSGLEFIHVTAIGLSANHLILTFCVDPFDPEESQTSHTEPTSDYDSFLNLIARDNLDDIFKAQNFNRLFRDAEDPTDRLVRQRRIRRPSRLLRGKRHARHTEDTPREESRYEKMVKFLQKSKTLVKLRRHLWTVILVKDNNTSALRFVENASILMKYGFKIKDGQLVSFGSCNLTKK